MISLEENIRNVMAFCQKRPQKILIKTGSMQARLGTQYLMAVANSLFACLSEEEKKNLYVTVSYGSGYFPRVLWVGICKKGKKVSNSMSVTICFGAEGEGLVVGAMFNRKVNDGPFATRLRSDTKKFPIGLNGGNAQTKYNNKFVNPLDMSTSEIDEDAILKHIRKSLSILRDFENSSDLKMV